MFRGTSHEPPPRISTRGCQSYSPGMPLADRTSLPARLRRWIRPLALPCAYLALLALVYGGTLGRDLEADEFEWVSGTFIYFAAQRQIQHLLLHEIAQPLFSDNLVAYRVMVLALHLFCALLVSKVFVQLFRNLGCTLRGRRGLVEGGGAFAGFLFLIYNTTTPTWIAAIAYQLVVLACLVAISAALAYLERPRTLLWITVLLAYGLALFSHVYALFLPAFLAILEFMVARKAPRSPHRRNIAIRYTALAFVLAFHLKIQPWIIGRGALGVASHDPSALLLLVPQYLVAVTQQFWVSNPTFSTATSPWLLWAWVAVGAVCLQGLRELSSRHTPVGIAGVFAVFYVTWNSLAFFQTLAGGEPFANSWRYYFCAVGFAVFAAYGVTVVAAAAGRLVPGAIRRPAEYAAAGLMAVLFLTGSARQRLGETLALATTDREIRVRFWRSGDTCQEMTRESEDGVRRALRTGHDLRCLDLSGIDLRSFDLRGVDLQGSTLREANLQGQDLRQTGLRDAYLVWARLDEADLRGVDLRGNNLGGASLQRADIRGTRLDRTFLNSARFEDATLDATTTVAGATFFCSLLTDVSWVAADLTRAQLSTTGLRGADLRHADLVGAELADADLENANLHEADLTGANLSGANLAGTDLTGANLTGANLRAVSLETALVAGANLEDAKLDREVVGTTRRPLSPALR